MQKENGCAPAVLTSELAAFLPQKRMETVHCFSSVASTNTTLKEMACDGAPDGTVVVAQTQTAGRGRQGKPFASAPGGIYLSYLYRPRRGTQDLTGQTALAAVAVCRALNGVCGTDCGIKWVNDVVIGTRKVCGILTEMGMEAESGAVNYVIFGIGINVNQPAEAFAGELADKAVSLAMATGKRFRCGELIARVITELERLIASPEDSCFEEYKARCVTLGKTVCLASLPTAPVGTATGLEGDYSLRVRFEDGTETLVHAGEVSVRGLFGYT